jgi:uncharacterized protein (TIGR00251 family)
MPACDLVLQVVPRSSQRKVEVTDQGQVKVWVTQAPTDGQANEGVIKALADALSLAPSKLEIVRGQTSRSKTVRIDGLACDEALSLLRSAPQGTKSPKQKGR